MTASGQARTLLATLAHVPSSTGSASPGAVSPGPRSAMKGHPGLPGRCSSGTLAGAVASWRQCSCEEYQPGVANPQWRCAKGAYVMTKLTITRRGLIGRAAASVG